MSPKKSLSEVQENLKIQLSTSARELMKQEYKTHISPDTALQATLNKLAVAFFKTVYGYEFSEDPNSIRPPTSLGLNCPVQYLCSMVSPLGNQLQQYIKRGVIDQIQLPNRIADAAQADLVNFASNLIEKDTQMKFKLVNYTHLFDYRIEDKDAYKCDSVMVCCNANLAEDGIAANLCVVYFLGVFYTAPTEIKTTRNMLCANAMKSAAALAGDPKIPSSVQALKETLDMHAHRTFKSEFNFDYATEPPASLRALDVPTAMVEWATNVYYVPDSDVWDLRNHVDHSIFSNINIPFSSIRNMMINDTISLYESIVKKDKTESWNMTSIDQVYAQADRSLNPIRQKAVVISWSGQKTTKLNTVVSVTYIYIMMAVYEEEPVQKQLLIKLLKSPQLNHLIAGKSKILDMFTMKDALLQYAKEKWNGTFKFEFQGSNTEIPDKRPNSKMARSFEKIFVIDKFPASGEAVEKWMDTELFQRTSPSFPPYMTSDLYDDIRDQMLKFASKDTPKDLNVWFDVGHTREFIDPTTSKRDIKHYGLFVYALGDMELGKVEGCAERAHAQTLVALYLGVMSTFTPNDW